MNPDVLYCGIYEDEFGGMTYTGSIVKDAWIFGILPESESCAGWHPGALQVLSSKVQQAWEQYGYAVTALPPEIRTRHERVHNAALVRARSLGWAPDMEGEEQ